MSSYAIRKQQLTTPRTPTGAGICPPLRSLYKALRFVVKSFQSEVSAVKKRILSLLLVFVLALNLVPVALAAEPVRVAVIDTGVSSAVVSPDNIAPGKNYILPGQSTEDKSGHGTAIAAIIAGSESAGITGICPEAVIVPLVWSTRNESGATVQGGVAMTAQAIRDAVDLYDCRVINLSAGTTSEDPALRKAVAYAEEKGALVVSSVGNKGNTAIYYPGAYETVVCVGACNAKGTEVTSFSNVSGAVDLAAPGLALQIADLKGGTTTASGTSFSCAYVSGAAARLLVEDPTLTAPQLRELLYETAKDIGPSGYDSYSGWGVLNLDAALAALREKNGTKPVFSDVKSGDYFYDPVLWAVEQGITNGVSATEFAPKTTCTQAHILTFLWRAAGSPAASGASRYTNGGVKSGEYFYEAFLWAWEKGVVTDRALDPKAPCSRADVVTYLWKLAGSPTVSLATFDDIAADAPYARAVAWAVKQNITNGISATHFGPDSTCTRGQIVTFLYRYFV